MREIDFVQLGRHEELLGIIRRSLRSRWWRYLFALVWLLTPFFFFYPLIKFGAFGFVIFALLIVFSVLNAVARWREWFFTMFVITDSRIIDIEHRGLFKRSIEELKIEEISDVTVRQGSIQKIFSLGIVHVQTIVSMKFDLELSGVARPNHVRDLLVDVQYLKRTYGNEAKSKTNN